MAPTYQQFFEARIVDVSQGEASHVGGEPRDSGHAHMDATGDLRLEVFEGGVHVAAPYQCAVSLRAHPCAPREVDDVAFAPLFQLSFVKRAVVLARVDVSRGYVGAGIVPVIGEIVGAVLGFGLIEPEGVDAKVRIVGLAFSPHELARLGIGGVEELVGLLVHVRHIDAPFAADEETVFKHGLVVLGFE